jgi:4-diphosphocytidyl-2-C-methyl-D-erythritol kinase
VSAKVTLFRAPAKINLTLEVLARRADGYHGIRSVMVPLALADELALGPSDAFRFTCDARELDGEENLVVRAARDLGSPPFAVHLRKRIPVQAGLGGGSSDAAALLRAAMNGALGRRRDADWVATARRLGSDVPFFLAGTGALVEGTGERVTPLGAMPAWHVLVTRPPVSVSTAAAYAELDRVERPSRPRAESVSMRMVEALQRGDFAAVEMGLHNDFAAVVAQRSPEITVAINALRKAGAANPMLTGSGSSVFTLARHATEIAEIVNRLALPSEYQRFVTAFDSTPDWNA